MSDDFQIDRSVKPKTWRSAVFSMTISAGTMINYQHWLPAADKSCDAWKDAKLQLLMDSDIFYHDHVGANSTTIEKNFDDFNDHTIIIRAYGLKHVACTEKQDCRLGFLLHDIMVENVSIQTLLNHTVQWCCTDGRIYGFPTLIADDGFAVVEIKRPVYRWLLDNDLLLQGK